MELDFDLLVDASRNGVNKTAEHDLWKAATQLDTWYFVARGTGDDAEPLIGALDGKPYLLAFTDDARAADFAKRRTMRASDARGSARDAASMQGGVLEMDIPDAVQYAHDLGQAGVEGVLFNSGGYAFQCSVPELVDRVKRYRGR